MKQSSFQKIALMGRAGIAGVLETLIAVKDHLLSLGYQVVFEANTASLLANNTLPAISGDQLRQHAELLIVIGGDGSLLHASHIAILQDLPVLGINRGRLGFLTDILPNELTQINTVLEGSYQEEHRFLLHASALIERKNQTLMEGLALNDVVLLPGNIAHMIEFDVFINQQFVCNHRADGLIVNTPTGSTAYALSAGGAILHPQLDAIALVPMFPHKLSSRPIVVQGDSEITLVIAPNNKTSPHLSCDGEPNVTIPPGTVVKIHKEPKRLRLIHPINYNYFQTLREKLGWQSRGIC